MSTERAQPFAALAVAVLAAGLLVSGCTLDAADNTSDVADNTSDVADNTPADNTSDSASDATIGPLGGIEVTVGIEQEYPPFHWADPVNGERTGFDHDLVAEACRRAGCEPLFTVHEWGTMIDDVSQGLIDMAASGIAVTAERKRLIDYSDPYLSNPKRVLARSGETRFSDIASLRLGDFTVAAQEATTNYAAAVGLVGEERVRQFAQTAQAVEALSVGEVDAAIVNEIAGHDYIRAHSGAVAFTGSNLAVDELAMIFTKGSPLVVPFNEALVSMRDDGTLEALESRYLDDPKNVNG